MNNMQLIERLGEMAYNVEKLNAVIGILSEEMTGRTTPLIDIAADYGNSLKNGFDSLLLNTVTKGGAQDE